MRTRMRPRPILLAALAVAALSAAALTACAGAPPQEQASGGQLFRQKCSNCHTLQEISAEGRVGPDLDQLKPNRQRVRAAIKNGGTSGTIMPKNLYTDGDADRVAAYVARTTGAAQPAPQPKPQPSGGGNTAQASAGAKLFKAKCGSCHTLAVAGTKGTIGPNLDDLKPNMQTVLAAMVAGPGVMPPNLYTGKNAKLVAQFVSQNAGKR